MGYNKSNTSPLLKRFLLRADELVNRSFLGEAYSSTLKHDHRKLPIKPDKTTDGCRWIRMYIAARKMRDVR